MPVGPYTNIALAIRKEPRLIERVKQVIVMGGAYTRGNITFEATAKAPHPQLRRLTYSLDDPDHYTRTLEQQMTPDAPFTAISKETCTRMTPLNV